MKNKIINALLVMMFGMFLSISAVFADNGDVFLSLTKKAQPVDELPTNTSVVTATQIKNMNAGSLGEVLNNEVGLSITQTGTLGTESDILIRGASSDQILVLVDGRKQNNLSTGIADLSAIPLDSIERIEIIRGAASAIYGADAIGGIINIITKKPKDSEPVVDLGLSYGSFNTQSQSVNIGEKQEKLSFMLAGSRNLSDGWRANSNCDSKDIFTDVAYNTGNLGSFDFSGSYFNSLIGSPGVGVSLDKYDGSIEQTASTPDATQSDDKKNITLQNQNKIGDSLIKTTLYFSNETLNYQDPLYTAYSGAPITPFNTDYKSTVYTGEVQLDTLYNITAGVEWSEEQYVQSNLESNLDEMDNSRINSAAYAQEKINIGGLTAIPGLRLDSNSSFGSIVSPKITLLYKIANNWKVSGNSGRGWRAPTFNDLYYNDPADGMSGNPNLKPEDAIASDLGLEYNKATTKAAITGFLTDTKNLIQWELSPSNSSVWLPTNIATSRQSGVEFVLKYKLLNGLFHKINYTYLWAVDTQQNTELIYRPCNTLNTSLTYILLSGIRLNLDAQYISSQETGSTPSQLPQYTVYDFGVDKNFGTDFKLWAKVKNLTGEKYQTRLDYPLPGMTAFVGINIKFVD